MWKNIRIIDTHSHILPGADHGSTSIVTSLRQIELAEKAKVDVIVATPHFYSYVDSIEIFIKRRKDSYSLLLEKLAGKKSAPEIKLAAEVALEPELFNLEHEELFELCIEGTKNLLLELPPHPWECDITSYIEKLYEEYKVNIVLVHIDRYEKNQIDTLYKNVTVPFKAQVNCFNLIKPFNKKRIIKMIDEGKISYLGSDMHGCAEHYDDMLSAMNVIGYRRTLAMMKSATELIKQQ